MITYLPPEQFLQDWETDFLSKGWAPAEAKTQAFYAMERTLAGSPLVKSLNVTNGIATDDSTGGDVLKIQQLMPNLALQIQRYQHFTVTYSRLNKKTAQVPTVEFNRVTSDGGRRGTGAISFSARDGGTKSRTSTQSRNSLNMAWYGQQYETFLPAQIMSATGIKGAPGPGQADKVNKQMAFERLMKDMNWATLHGDDTKNFREPRGLLAQYRVVDNTEAGTTRLDMAGDPVTSTTLAILSRMLRNRGGQATDITFASSVMEGFQMQLLANMSNSVKQGESAVQLLAYAETALVQALGQNTATCKLHRDPMLEAYGAPPVTAEDDAPTRPTSVTPTVSAAASSNALGRYLEPASYYYFCTALGVKGESIARASAVAAVGANEKVSLAIKKADANTDCFFIYRSETNDASTAELINRVDCADVAVGSDATFIDDGEFIPGCSTGLVEYVQSLDDGHYSTEMLQFYPVTERELPKTALANSTIILSAFTPIVITPGFGIVIENIGPWSTSNS